MTIMDNCIYMMDEIRNKLTVFVSSFPSVSFRLMYDEQKDYILISYEVSDSVGDDDLLWDEIASLKAQIKQECCDNEPLFSHGDTTFKVSVDAEVIECGILSIISNDSFETATYPSYAFSLDNDCSCFQDGYEDFLLAA